MRDYNLYLRDILESIERIDRSTESISKEVFKEDVNIQDAVLRRLEIIGEAVTNIPLKIKEEYPEVEWKKIIGFRIVAAHSYFKINLDIIWDIIKNKLPELKIGIKNILENNK